MEKKPKFSVGVSTYNRNQDLDKCLKALTEQTYKDFEVIVANGGDVEGVQKVIDAYPQLDITLVTQRKKGVVRARNLGWQHGKGEISCLIDDDLVVSPQWLEEVNRTFEADENIGGVSGPTIIPSSMRSNRDFALLLEKKKGFGGAIFNFFIKIYKAVILENKQYEVGKILASGTFTPGSNYESCLKLENPIEVDYLEACHMCFRMFLLKEIGGFDEGYVGTGEWNEPEFSFKVRKKGYRLLFNPKAVTEHHISQAGVFKARTNAYERSLNFIQFYFRWVKPNTFNKFFRFTANLFFINTYWVYKFMTTGNADWLRGITGTFKGLLSRPQKEK